jgi:predicted TPR repeat methyltransferase
MPEGTAAPPLAEQLCRRAEALLAAGHPAEALPLLDRAALLAPGQGSAVAARVRFALGDMAGAAEAATVALAAAPEDAALLRLRALARFSLGLAEAALDDAAAAVMAAPGDRLANLTFGELLAETGRHEDALVLLLRALAADPGDLTAMLRLARGCVLAGRHEDAEALLAEAEARAPGVALVAAQRVQARLVAGDPAGAERVAQAALARGLAEGPVHNALAHVLVAQGRMAEAAPHFRAASRLAPQDAYLAHLAAAASGITTDRPGGSYVATLFDGYAARFEASLLSLGYRVPGLIRRAVEARLEAAGRAALAGPVLDLGCGTGLVGVALLDLAPEGLVGVDLSANMLREAAGKGLYRELRQADIAAAMGDDPARYELITAADVFCYLGALDEVLALCARRLAPGGALMFSVETGAGQQPWQLGPSGRYGHARNYVEQAVAGAGLALRHCAEEALRLDGDGRIEGLFVVAERQEAEHAREPV